jgi:hypothetical protein
LDGPDEWKWLRVEDRVEIHERVACRLNMNLQGRQADAAYLIQDKVWSYLWACGFFGA